MRSIVAVGVALIVALVPFGCGSHPEGVSAMSESQLAPAPTGPCDEQHREQAVAAAAAAARKALGDVKLSDPESHFLGVFAHPQMPGQPAQEPTFGWNVTFTAALPGPSADGDAFVRPPQAELMSPGVSVLPPAELAPPAAQLASAANADAANGIPRPRDPPPPPNRPPAVHPAAPRDTLDAKRTRIISVFVAVDGAARMQ